MTDNKSIKNRAEAADSQTTNGNKNMKNSAEKIKNSVETAKITRDKFKTIGKNSNKMETISRPNVGYWQDAWRRIRKNKIAFLSLCLVIIYVLMAIFAPMFSQYTHYTQSVEEMNQGFSKTHWFGTDSLGRDLWVRAWMGARVSLSIGFIASIINSIIGSIIGGISGYYGGKVDMIIQRLVDVIYGIPSMIVTILLMVVLGSGVQCLIIAMVCVGWIGSCRFVRGEVLKLRESDFVAAAKILGVPDMVIIIKHILPNIMGLIITNLTMAIPNAIFNEAFLSYIGLGVKPPNCSWGILAKEGIANLRVYPYQVIIPSILICTTMLALNLLGDGLRDAFDPKLRGTE